MGHTICSFLPLTDQVNSKMAGHYGSQGMNETA